MTEDFSKINGEGTTLRKAQLRMLDILIEVDKICRKHNIQYWLIAGTVLGAVRHGGFIPWDDDIDITVEHKDLKRLAKVLKAELPEQFVYQDYKTDKNFFKDSAIKIKDKKSFFPQEIYRNVKEQGLFLDIIPMEKIPSMRFKRFVFKANKHPYLRRKDLSYLGKSSNLKGLLFAPFASLLTKFAHWYSSISATNTYGFNYTFLLLGYFDMKFPKDVLFPLKTIEFEGKEFYVPNDLDKYLTILYGDYMKLPPLEKRRVHGTQIEVYD